MSLRPCLRVALLVAVFAQGGGPACSSGAHDPGGNPGDGGSGDEGGAGPARGGSGGRAKGGAGGGANAGGGGGAGGGSAGGGNEDAAAGGSPGQGGMAGQGGVAGVSGEDAGPDAEGGAGGAGGGGVDPSGPILLVTANDPQPAPVTGMMAALTDAGLKFVMQNSSSQPLTPAAAMGKSLVIINPNTPRGNVPAAFKDVLVPVMVSKDGPSNTMMMVTGESSTAPTLHAITIIAPDDPLAAGFPMGNVTVYGPGNRLIFGNPGPEAKKVATVAGNANEIAIYYFNAGATMAGGFKAPAKRVGFFWHRTSDVTPDGRKLFIAAVKWAMQP